MEEPRAPLSLSGPFARLLYFTAIVPYVRFRERLDRRVAIHPDFNDVCISAADLSVACYHLPEHLDDEAPHLAAAIRAIPEWKGIGDIANTRKHVRRHNAKREVSLRASLMFELGPEGGYRFVATNVFARCDAWPEEVNVSALLSQFINSALAETGLFPDTRVSPHFQVVGDFEPKARSLIGPESFGMDRTDFQLVRIKPDGTAEPSPAGFLVETEFELDMPEQQRFGAHVMKFDPAAAAEWLVAAVIAEPTQA